MSDIEYEEYMVDEHYQPKNKFMLNHNWRMFGGFFIVFLIGGLQALKGITWTSGIETVLPLLLAAEHLFNGRTD